MNKHEWIMAERVALITSLVMDLNSSSAEFSAELNYKGYINKVDIIFYKKLNNDKNDFNKNKYDFSGIFRMYTYLDENFQDDPPKCFCTIDQIIYILNQIIKCITEDCTNENNAETIVDCFTPATMDKRS